MDFGLSLRSDPLEHIWYSPTTIIPCLGLFFLSQQELLTDREIPAQDDHFRDTKATVQHYCRLRRPVHRVRRAAHRTRPPRSRYISTSRYPHLFSRRQCSEQWGFLRNQVTPFHLTTPDNETLHAWHILPLEAYRKHEKALRNDSVGLCSNIEERLSFNLLKDDPDAQLVIYFHGAAGTLGSGWRPQSYRAISAAALNVHILAIDYRGYGTSTGWPSEAGLLTDALTLAKFSMGTAGIPPERIVMFAQSLGTAVSISLAHHLANQSPPTLFAGMVLVAPMADVELLTATYKVGGTFSQDVGVSQ